MGYLALALLIVVVGWTLWRSFNRQRLPMDYFSPQEKEEDEKTKGDSPRK